MTKTTNETTSFVVTAPNFEEAAFVIEGTAPYVQHKFSQKSKQQLMEDMMRTKKRKKSELPPKDFDDDYEQATHFGEDGRPGIPAAAFRAAMVDACRLVPGVAMTEAKLCVFVTADTVDRDDGAPLVHIWGSREKLISHVRIGQGTTTVTARPMWRKWKATVRLSWDADQLSADSVLNLLSRVGQQVGIGEGRPFSKKSTGQGWGTFEVTGVAEVAYDDNAEAA